MSEILSLALVGGASMVPPVLYLVWVRGWEVCRRESLKDLYKALAIGGTFSVLLAIMMSTVFNTLFYGLFRIVIPVPMEMEADLGLLISVVLVAPLVEEPAKLIGLGLMKGKIRELEDGLVYGMATGFGFALTENIIYGWEELLYGGLLSGLALVAFRSALSSFLHASATAVSGLGLSKWVVTGLSGGRATLLNAMPYLGAAIALHATYNSLSSSSILFGPNLAAGILSLMIVPLVYSVLNKIRRMTKDLDRRFPCIEFQ
ncbi:MAG: PrsW family glutamic-type intramembrane protease [Candidatus Verstraetearchaeota archaeon]|nr:PrsW family glutamic-type intramembrane protease [Candidatus Verstraetearchaeota archaeon]